MPLVAAISIALLLHQDDTDESNLKSLINILSVFSVVKKIYTLLITEPFDASCAKYFLLNHSDTFTRLINPGTSTSGPITAARRGLGRLFAVVDE